MNCIEIVFFFPQFLLHLLRNIVEIWQLYNYIIIEDFHFEEICVDFYFKINFSNKIRKIKSYLQIEKLALHQNLALMIN